MLYHNRSPRHQNRYELLRQLERQEKFVHALDDFFIKIADTIAPNRKKPLPSSGYSESVVEIQTTKRRKLRFYQLMYELKRDGLIEEKNTEGDRIIRITARGTNWLKKKRDQSTVSLPKFAERAEKSERVIIVSYDIPEKAKYLREWLRSALKNLGLKPLQKSVWFGKVKLPDNFLKGLIKLDMEKYVEIFEISKTGTLRHLI